MSRVRLIPAGQSTPVWTLVYAYRLVPRSVDAASRPSDAVPIELGNGEFRYSIEWQDYSPARKVVWSDPVVECIYVFEGEVSTRGITLMRPPSESLWLPDASNPRRWATDEDDLLARFQGGTTDRSLLLQRRGTRVGSGLK